MELKLIYEEGWNTYEEWGRIRIYEDEHGAFFYQLGGYSVMSSSNADEWGELCVASGEDVLELIDEWEAIALENEEYWKNNHWG